MIESNAALYIGIVTACVLEQFPTATVLTERVGHALASASSGYRIAGSVSIGTGADRRSYQSAHEFLDVQTRGVQAAYLSDSARSAGESICSELRKAR